MTQDTHRQQHHFESPENADYAELEAEVLFGLTTQAVDSLYRLSQEHGLAVGLVHDIGCGPGVASCVLAERFGPARIVASDSSAVMLERTRHRAQRLGVSARVDTRRIELHAGADLLPPGDLVWASQVLHHLGPGLETLASLRRLLVPGGLLAVSEPAGPLRITSGETEWERRDWTSVDEAWTRWFTGTFPDTSPRDAALERAGFELVLEEELILTLDPPLSRRARRYAQNYVRGLQHLLTADRDRGDLQFHARVGDPESDQGVLNRDDVGIEATRLFYVAHAM